MVKSYWCSLTACHLQMFQLDLHVTLSRQTILNPFDIQIKIFGDLQGAWQHPYPFTS